MRKSFPHSETTSQVRTGGSFQTSEGSAVVGAQETKWREFTTEVIVEQHFPAKSGSHIHTHSREWVRDAEAQAWVSDPGREPGLAAVRIF